MLNVRTFTVMNTNKNKLLKLFLRIEKNAEKIKFFRSNFKYLISISGGQDSICLALILRSLQRKFNLQIDIVYCQHAWQQENFFNVIQILKYAIYTQTNCFIFLNPKQNNITSSLNF